MEVTVPRVDAGTTRRKSYQRTFARRGVHPLGEVEVATTVEGDRAVLRVVNTGPMIQPDDLDRLAQPFQRLAADRNGDFFEAHELLEHLPPLPQASGRAPGPLQKTAVEHPASGRSWRRSRILARLHKWPRRERLLPLETLEQVQTLSR